MKITTKDYLGDVELVRGNMYAITGQVSCDRSDTIKGRLDSYNSETLSLDTSTRYKSELTRISYSTIIYIGVEEND